MGFNIERHETPVSEDLVREIWEMWQKVPEQVGMGSHISELTDDRNAKPEDILQPGQKVEVRVIRVDIDERKIGLSFVHSDFEENESLPPAHETTADPEATAEVETGADPEAPADPDP